MYVFSVFRHYVFRLPLLFTIVVSLMIWTANFSNILFFRQENNYILTQTFTDIVK